MTGGAFDFFTINFLIGMILGLLLGVSLGVLIWLWVLDGDE